MRISWGSQSYDLVNTTTTENLSAWQVNGGTAMQAAVTAEAAAPLVGGGYHPSQGLYPRPPDKHQISRARKRLGLEDEVAKAIAHVAARQAETLELDAQKRFEELHRELQLRGIEWEARYLEALNLERERLIDAEIASRLKEKLRRDNEDIIVLMLLAASVCE